ncbi:MAG: hypothetical protein ACRD2N_09575 [Vicinamibacterales bacterium]
MVPAYRQSFNASWSEARYESLHTTLEKRSGAPLGFHLSETPCFYSRSLMNELARLGAELVEQSLTGDAGRAGADVVPDRYRGPGAGGRPAFLCVDFGLVRAEDGTIQPRLVELQAFASLFGFQLAVAEAYRDAYQLPSSLGFFIDESLNHDSYQRLLATHLVGDHDAQEVVLLEIQPKHQKTWPDFVATEALWGVRAIDTGDVEVEGRKLFYRRDGRRLQIKRIYNRVIPDELEKKKVQLPFDYREDYDVEWLGHPAWYFRVSKFSIPWLTHPCVPRTWYLNELDRLPADRDNYLLKPLFSFAGGGITFAPTDEEIAAIPVADRRNYILQERIHFTPVIDTPHGATQSEIRVMYIWTDRLRALLPLIRMGRGKMMGVDYNKGLRWVGASAGFIVN